MAALRRLGLVGLVMAGLLSDSSDAAPPVLRPQWGYGDPLWSGSSTMCAVGDTSQAPLWMELSAWSPFGVEGLSVMTFGLGGRLGGWRPGVRGVLLQAPRYRELWVDAGLGRAGPGLGWSAGGGTGWRQFGDFQTWSGWSLYGAVAGSVPRGSLGCGWVVCCEPHTVHDSERWSWQGAAGGTWCAAEDAVVFLQVRENHVQSGSVVTGLTWRPPAGRDLRAVELGLAFNLSARTQRFHFGWQPWGGMALEFWTHVHPVLGWTPGLELAWGC
ncbi:MAG: hypothetical protein GF355_04345 [Candidatus Eisenbacteria bacterium]|nr:hypothetical protein [Candidatus Eisenbacteria bacterium]